MKKIIILITILGIVIWGGTLWSKNTATPNSNTTPAVLGSLKGKQQLHKATLLIDGMWCSSCAVGAEYNLKAIEGVVDAYVGFTDNLDGNGWVIYEQGKVTDEQIIEAIEPYQATIKSDVIYTETK